MAKNTLKDSFEQCIKEASISALNSLVADMKRRIHQEGKKTDGSQIGDYNKNFVLPENSYSDYLPGEKYVAYRKRKGRQVGYIDLQLYKNLSDSFQVGQDGNRFFAGFDSAEQYEIAQKHTDHYGQIWKPSEDEKQYCREEFGKIYRQCLNQLFKR